MKPSPNGGREMESRIPSLVDLNAELAKLTMFRRTPQSTREQTKGSVARLASYRDGLLLAIKAAGKGHWERHLAGDELIHILDGTATLDIVGEDGPKSFCAPRRNDRCQPAGCLAPLSVFRRVTLMAATPFPSE